MTGKAAVLFAAMLAGAAGPGRADAQIPPSLAGQAAPSVWASTEARVAAAAYYASEQSLPPAGDSLGADWREQQNEARQKVAEGRHVPLGQVIDSIRRQTPGRLLDTGIEQGPEGRSVYRVRWVTAGGRRIDFLVDARSGEILASQGR